jgi:hypothetical protein
VSSGTAMGEPRGRSTGVEYRRGCRRSLLACSEARSPWPSHTHPFAEASVHRSTGGRTPPGNEVPDLRAGPHVLTGATPGHRFIERYTPLQERRCGRCSTGCGAQPTRPNGTGPLPPVDPQGRRQDRHPAGSHPNGTSATSSGSTTPAGYANSPGSKTSPGTSPTQPKDGNPRHDLADREHPAPAHGLRGYRDSLFRDRTPAAATKGCPHSSHVGRMWEEFSRTGGHSLASRPHRTAQEGA